MDDGAKIKICFAGNTPVYVEIEAGISLAAAAERASVAHGQTCMKHGRCGFCMVVVESGMENLIPPGEEESRALRILKAESNQRLACQAKANGDVVCRFTVVNS
jgi:ferredoxin